MTFVEETIQLMNERGIKMISTNDVELHKDYISIGLDMQCFPCVTTVQYHSIDKDNNKCELYDPMDDIIITNLPLEDECYDVKYTKDLQECCDKVYDNWAERVRKSLKKA